VVLRGAGQKSKRERPTGRRAMHYEQCAEGVRVDQRLILGNGGRSREGVEAQATLCTAWMDQRSGRRESNSMERHMRSWSGVPGGEVEDCRGIGN